MLMLPATYLIPALLELSIEEIINELTLETQQAEPAEAPKQEVKKDTAAALFGGGSDWSDESDSEEDTDIFNMALGKKKAIDDELTTNKNINSEYDQTFIDNFEKTIELIKEKSSRLRLSEKSTTDLINFLSVFRTTYKKEFFSDTVTNYLLRKFTTDFKLTEESQKTEDEDEKIVRADQILNQHAASTNAALMKAWSSMDVALAYQS